MEKSEIIGLLESKGWTVITSEWPNNVMGAAGELGIIVFAYDGDPSIVRYDHLDVESTHIEVVDLSPIKDLEILTPAEAQQELKPRR